MPGPLRVVRVVDLTTAMLAGPCVTVSVAGLVCCSLFRPRPQSQHRLS
jgi:hypothetical protein